MINENQSLILEDGFDDIVLAKKNCISIQLKIFSFLNNRKDNQYLAVDTSPDVFHDKTVFLYIEKQEDGVMKILNVEYLD